VVGCHRTPIDVRSVMTDALTRPDASIVDAGTGESNRRDGVLRALEAVLDC